jgi:hypothetical protein
MGRLLRASHKQRAFGEVAASEWCRRQAARLQERNDVAQAAAELAARAPAELTSCWVDHAAEALASMHAATLHAAVHQMPDSMLASTKSASCSLPLAQLEALQAAVQSFKLREVARFVLDKQAAMCEHRQCLCPSPALPATQLLLERGCSHTAVTDTNGIDSAGTDGHMGKAMQQVLTRIDILSRFGGYAHADGASASV